MSGDGVSVVAVVAVVGGDGRLVRPGLTLLLHGVVEGEEGQLGHREVLEAERDAQDGQAQQHAEQHMGDREPEPADDDPDDVHDALGEPVAGRLLQFPSERPHDVAGQLEGLDAERDADDRETRQQARQQVGDAEPHAAQHEPQHVADGLHEVLLGVAGTTGSTITVSGCGAGPPASRRRGTLKPWSPPRSRP